MFMENVILIANEVRQLFMENVILIAKEVRHVHKHLFTFKYGEILDTFFVKIIIK